MPIKPPEHLGSVIERWKQRQDEWTKLDASVKAAPLIGEMLADLEALGKASDDELNLTDAARVSGYSPDHLSRLVRDGKLSNYGRRGAPRVKRSELPVRSSNRVAANARNAYDVSADVRSLGTRR